MRLHFVFTETYKEAVEELLIQDSQILKLGKIIKLQDDRVDELEVQNNDLFKENYDLGGELLKYKIIGMPLCLLIGVFIGLYF
jgi:hypothetical protein